MAPEISIVMTYHDRKELLLRTLKGLDLHPYKNFEVVIVDDASNELNRLEGCLNFSFETTLIRINPENKTWINSCVPYNIGFSHARGDKIIIQNPECMHISDLIFKTLTIKNNEYFSFRCYSLDPDTSNLFNESLNFENKTIDRPDGTEKLNFESLCDVMSRHVYTKLPQISCDTGQYAPAWFNHKSHRAHGFHFASAIKRSDLFDLGGFDERFANGYCFDDNDLVLRVQKRKMNLVWCEETVVHQWHDVVVYHKPNFTTLYNRNKFLKEQVEASPNYKALETRLK